MSLKLCLTIFRCVSRLGCRRDFAWRCSVVTNLVQEVDGFANEQNLERRGDEDELNLTSGKSNRREINGLSYISEVIGWSCVGAFTLRAWSMVMNEGIIDFLREYLSCHRRSVFTLGSDATKNYTHTHIKKKDVDN